MFTCIDLENLWACSQVGTEKGKQSDKMVHEGALHLKVISIQCYARYNVSHGVVELFPLKKW